MWACKKSSVILSFVRTFLALSQPQPWIAPTTFHLCSHMHATEWLWKKSHGPATWIYHKCHSVLTMPTNNHQTIFSFCDSQSPRKSYLYLSTFSSLTDFSIPCNELLTSSWNFSPRLLTIPLYHQIWWSRSLLMPFLNNIGHCCLPLPFQCVLSFWAVRDNALFWYFSCLSGYSFPVSSFSII